MTTSAAVPATGAVVLAAGEARRLGGCPKPLIERDGVPLVRRVTAAILEAGVCEVVVVLGHRAADLAAALAGLPVRTVVNAGYAAGRVSSLRKGLAALPDSVNAALVALADQPLLEAADVTALLEAFARRGAARAVVPRAQGSRGHPVIFDAVVRQQILAGDAAFGARQWMDAHPAEVAWFDTANVHYSADVDRPEDLERIAREHGCTMRWPS